MHANSPWATCWNNYFPRTSVQIIISRRSCRQKCHKRFLFMFTTAWLFSFNYSIHMLFKVDFRNRHKRSLTVSSSRSVPGGLLDLTNQTIEIKKTRPSCQKASDYVTKFWITCIWTSNWNIQKPGSKTNALSFVHTPFDGYFVPFINWVTNLDRTWPRGSNRRRP